MSALAVASRVALRGLEHNVLRWSTASSNSSKNVVLLHGWADAAQSWQWVAPTLAASGFTVFAPDLRGFGETEWVREPGYYYFPDYVADTKALLDHLGLERVYLVGHSMGGTVSTLLAGAYPERFVKVALLEGTGPPDNDASANPDRMRRWITDLDRHRRAPQEKRGLSEDDAVRRLALQHSNVPTETLRQCVRYLTTSRADGSLTWRFDPLHRSTSPVAFQAATYKAFASQITCPVLLVDGGPTGFHPPDEQERFAAFAQHTIATIDDAGHMMHWTKPEKLASILLDFFQ